MNLGIDKSSLDGVVDYVVMASRGIKFVTMRASYSTSVDLNYAESIKALEAGIDVMPYHWYKPRVDPVEQANVFIKSVNEYKANMPPLIDLEDYYKWVAYKGVAKELKVWLETVEDKTHLLPYLYASPSYIKNYLTTDTFLSRYPLIIAHWDVPAPLVPKPFTPANLQAWQFGDNRDAVYYGFLQSKGCAMYAWLGENYVTDEWKF